MTPRYTEPLIAIAAPMAIAIGITALLVYTPPEVITVNLEPTGGPVAVAPAPPAAQEPAPTMPSPPAQAALEDEPQPDASPQTPPAAESDSVSAVPAPPAGVTPGTPAPETPPTEAPEDQLAKAAPVEPTVSAESAAEATTQGLDGAAIAAASCLACHQTGVMDAPKLDDAANWQKRAEQGIEVLLDHVINGFNSMPPKGGNPQLSDAEVRAALEYMLAQVGLATGSDSASADSTTPEVAESAPSGEPEQTPSTATDPQMPVAEPPATESSDRAAAESTPTAAEPVVAEPPLDEPSSTASSDSPVDAAAQADTETKPEPPAQLAAVQPAPPPPATAEPPAVTRIDPAAYERACASCHDEGVDNAPRIGDQNAWLPNLSLGIENLVEKMIAADSSHPRDDALASMSRADIEESLQY
ncbi:MAG: c-type cytochrome, partial [Gammaproteobacteria bacterium]|nr:c-type cytochrome [Gammaproteobacteria bacterium]